MKIDYQSLEKKIDHKFKDKKLLIKSLTHKSYDKINNNEKIEFLGDRVLGLIIAKKLLEIYPDEKEGILDKKFASLVNKKTCLQIAKKINLGLDLQGGSYLLLEINSDTLVEEKIQSKVIPIKKLLKDPIYLDSILLDGVEKANKIASEKIKNIKEIVGF